MIEKRERGNLVKTPSTSHFRSGVFFVSFLSAGFLCKLKTYYAQYNFTVECDLVL